jgi:prophage tail gpP-like protein
VPTATVPAGTVQTTMQASAHDGDVPRYRPRVVLAESQLTQAQMQLRANWMKAYAYGRSTEAQITVQGWRQPDGSLWGDQPARPSDLGLGRRRSGPAGGTG